jgi:hypothetical protein
MKLLDAEDFTPPYSGASREVIARCCRQYAAAVLRQLELAHAGAGRRLSAELAHAAAQLDAQDRT